MLGLLVIGARLRRGKGKANRRASRAEFHQRLDGEDFASIYAGSHPAFKAATTEKDFVAILAAVHRKLGVVTSSEQAGWQVNSFNLQTTVVLRYKTKFSDGEAAETFGYRIEGTRALLINYNINSAALITK